MNSRPLDRPDRRTGTSGEDATGRATGTADRGPLVLCGDCRFWKGEGTGRLGECESEKFKRGYNTLFDAVPIDGVLVENDEGWAFYTGREFGCIHGAA